MSVSDVGNEVDSAKRLAPSEEAIVQTGPGQGSGITVGLRDVKLICDELLVDLF